MNAAVAELAAAVFMDSGFRRNDGAVLKWRRALARFEKAEAAIAAAAGAPDHVYGPIGARHHSALARLLHTPAPDLAALARKLDLALDERTGEFDGDSAAMRILKQDATRLMAPRPNELRRQSSPRSAG